MSKWNYCTWPLENGQDCGKAIAPDKDYCPEHEQEARAWDADAKDMNQIKREWDQYAHGDDETPPWKQSDPQEVILHLLQENNTMRRDLNRAYEQAALSFHEAATRLRFLLDVRVEEDTERVTGGNSVVVDAALINALLKLVQEEAVRKLATEPAPRMVIEAKGEAQALVEMQQAELARLKADTRQFLAGIVQTYRDNPAFDLHHAVAQMRRFIEQKL